MLKIANSNICLRSLTVAVWLRSLQCWDIVGRWQEEQLACEILHQLSSVVFSEHRESRARMPLQFVQVSFWRPQQQKNLQHNGCYGLALLDSFDITDSDVIMDFITLNY